MKRTQQRSLRRQRGSSIVEAACGGIMIIWFLLGFLDMACVIAAQYVADSVAYDVCRVAASASSSSQAQQQANQELPETYQQSPIIGSISIQNINYQKGNGNGDYGLVTLKLNTVVDLIVPMPFLGNQLTMQEQATLPLLSNLSS